VKIAKNRTEKQANNIQEQYQMQIEVELLNAQKSTSQLTK